uniref:Small ribosomal subunit protein uS3c n=3 Tax=Araceae TaxID=4454 RepID=A0A481YN09_9ARAE|nr:ribosomal protein S3 [Epipremnum aureum]YP_009582467.1 ribosomal protein S3 [Zantedeschia hybrid cultivar]ALB38621.1 ribosomal protein S3 [Epipremnum aureum]QBK84089.1 ribosomal protein S3 [Zantedeschia hybrid cultivar]QJF46713.1 ribosomal protein S3 [Zantedeschia rehmannii]
MARKINPLAFRLGTTQNHHSLWFAQPKRFSTGLQEDEKIRDCINNYIQNRIQNYIQKNIRRSSNFEEIGITHIEIQKKIDGIEVIIYIAFPNFLIEDRDQIIKELQTNVQKELNSINQKLKISITKIENPYGQPIILAKYIALQLENRIPSKKAMKKAIELTKETNTKGIKIQISGRIAGKEVARAKWIRSGRVPLQTIRAKINYCCYPVQTVHGILGIKVWTFVDGE